jgi:type II secretory pathway pseudopilin PulG
MIEIIVAVSVLLIAILMSMQPVMGALVRIAEARRVTVASNLAQAEIEAIRALEYEDVGTVGHAPEGDLPRERVVEVDGRRYLIEVAVSFQGSATGLDVIDQGGDGVEGAWDAGVD